MTDDEMAQAVVNGLTSRRATTCYCGRDIMVHRELKIVRCQCGREWRYAWWYGGPRWTLFKKNGVSAGVFGRNDARNIWEECFATWDGRTRRT